MKAIASPLSSLKSIISLCFNNQSLTNSMQTNPDYNNKKTIT